jgi:hypothetical protein
LGLAVGLCFFCSSFFTSDSSRISAGAAVLGIGGVALVAAYVGGGFCWCLEGHGLPLLAGVFAEVWGAFAFLGVAHFLESPAEDLTVFCSRCSFRSCWGVFGLLSNIDFTFLIYLWIYLNISKTIFKYIGRYRLI